MRSLDVGIAFELRADLDPGDSAPVDALEEYDDRETIAALVAALTALGHRPRPLRGGRAFLQSMLAHPPELVFNNSEGRGSRSREAQVPAVCEMLGIACTHSDPLAMALSLDKAMAKRVLQSGGVRTAPFRVVSAPGDARRLDLPFPLFVKPLAEGSSMGVRVTSRVEDGPALRREIERCCHDYRQPALVETFLPGVEATVAVLGVDDDARVLGIMEVASAGHPAGDFIYGLESKRNWRQLVRYHSPPLHLSPEQCADAERAALASHRLLGCRDVSRVDVRFDAAGHANVLEINLLPGLNPVTGDLVVMAGLMGVSYTDLIGRIVAAAIGRYPALG